MSMKSRVQGWRMCVWDVEGWKVCGRLEEIYEEHGVENEEVRVKKSLAWRECLLLHLCVF